MSRYDLDAPAYDQDEELRLAIAASLADQQGGTIPSPVVLPRPTSNGVPRYSRSSQTDELAIAYKLSLAEEEKRKKKEEDEKRKAAQDRYLEERHAEEREKWPTDPQVAVAPPEKELTAEERREQIRQSWLNKMNPVHNDVNSQSLPSDAGGGQRDNVQVITLDSEDEENEETLIPKRSRKIDNRRATPLYVEDDSMDMSVQEETGERCNSPPPPDNMDDTVHSDEMIACHLQEAEMRGEDDEDMAYLTPRYVSQKEDEEQKQLEKIQRELQEKEDEELAKQLQEQMEEQDEDLAPRYDRHYRSERTPAYSYGDDWGARGPAPVVVRTVTRTTTSPTSGRRVVTTTTTQSTSTTNNNIGYTSYSNAHNGNSDLPRLRPVDIRSRQLFDLLEGMSSNLQNTTSSLDRYSGIPLNYMRHHSMSDSDDEEDIDGMTYEDLLNLPTVERGVDDKNLYPTATHSKSDTVNTSCSVCLENYEEGDEQRILPCFHKFHKGCIDRWLEGHKTCPVCKYDLSEN